MEGQADPEHLPGDHRGMRHDAETRRVRRSRPSPRSSTSRANGATYDAIGKRYGLVGKTFNLFSKLRGGMKNNVSIELKAVK